MLSLGHITYSNCFPPHSGILTGQVPFPFNIVEGIPSELNRKLSEASIDVSPCSSIEFASNSDRYLLLPDLSISCKGKVMSIIVQSKVPFDCLHGKVVALTAASATSVVLLRILLEIHHGLQPRYFLYEQGVDDPSRDADAFLTIGDLAITQQSAAGFDYRYDLGELWFQYTGLPFVFALWQVNFQKSIEKDLSLLCDILKMSKKFGLSHLRELSQQHESKFKIPAEVLYDYWNSFSYDFGPHEQKGLRAFYEQAEKIGVIEAVPELRFWNPM